MKKFYFGASIRGGREHVSVYEEIKYLLSNYGEVLTEHVADKTLTSQGEVTRKDEDIFARDVEWINEADVLVMECTGPSLGVGWETAYGQWKGKIVLWLYNEKLAQRSLSAMVAGNPYVKLLRYRTLDDVKQFFNQHLKA